MRSICLTMKEGAWDCLNRSLLERADRGLLSEGSCQKNGGR